MDYFNNYAKLVEIQNRMAAVNLRLDVHQQEGSKMTTYHIVRTNPNANFFSKIFGFDIRETLATEISTADISRRMTDIVAVEEAAWDLYKLSSKHVVFFG
ncbi:hypothetical protein AWB71_05997 [Caballeronia peredens]|nr:hypothetical protein AWB71_05997 [Caballeronia peredens]